MQKQLYKIFTIRVHSCDSWAVLSTTNFRNISESPRSVVKNYFKSQLFIFQKKGAKS